MQSDDLRPDRRASQVRQATELGMAVLLQTDAGRGSVSLASALAWLEAPIRMGQALIQSDRNGRPLAMVTWAYVAEETLDRLAAGEQAVPAYEQWNEGALVWIVDVVAPHGGVAELLRSLDRSLSERHATARWIRRGRAGRASLRFARHHRDG